MSTNDHVIGKILFTEAEIRKRAEELGEEISNEFKGEELVVIGTLKGSIPWMCDLMKCLDLDTVIDFVKASSYGSSTTSGVVKISMIRTEPAQQERTGGGRYRGYGNHPQVPVGEAERAPSENPEGVHHADKPSRELPISMRITSASRWKTCSSSATAWITTRSTGNLPYISYLQNEGK